MQIIILATNDASRLPPLTDHIPAPLLPVVDRPVMASTVEILARSGCKHLLVSLLHRGGSIAAYFGSGKQWGVDIEYITQQEDWGSAGALKWAAGLLKETFLVIPGDAIIDLDVESALEHHRAHGGVATVVLHRPREDSTAPTLRVTSDHRVTAPEGASSDGDALAATGVYLFEPDVLRYIPSHTYVDSIQDVIPTLLAKGEAVVGYELCGYWNPLRSLQEYQEAQRVFLYSAYAQRSSEQTGVCPTAQVRFPSLGGRQVAPGIWVGTNDSIHPSVKLAAPVYIGANSWIGREVELGAGCVIGSRVVIDEEATVSDSTVLSSTYVGRFVNIERSIINATTMIDPATGDYTRVVDPFLLSRLNAPLNVSRRFSRIANALAAACILAGLSPVLILTWLLAAISTKGRPITRSPRVGRRIKTADGVQKLHIFEQLHFQTRTATGNYTLLGRLLEGYELHRLPELVNVLHGDMALVGIKPLTPEEESQLTEDWHHKRHDASAGFTGLWYMQTETSRDLDTTLVADVYYAATRSWYGDIRILGKTPGVWLRRHLLSDDRSSNRPEALIPTTLVEKESQSETT